MFLLVNPKTHKPHLNVTTTEGGAAGTSASKSVVTTAASWKEPEKTASGVSLSNSKATAVGEAAHAGRAVARPTQDRGKRHCQQPRDAFHCTINGRTRCSAGLPRELLPRMHTYRLRVEAELHDAHIGSNFFLLNQTSYTAYQPRGSPPKPAP